MHKKADTQWADMRLPKDIFYILHDQGSGVSSMELRVLEHPPQLWHLSSSVTNTAMIIDN